MKSKNTHDLIGYMFLFIFGTFGTITLGIMIIEFITNKLNYQEFIFNSVVISICLIIFFLTFKKIRY